MMICYILRVEPKDGQWIKVYSIFENNTNSFLEMGARDIIELAKRGKLQLINADIINDNIEIHEWPNKVDEKENRGVADYVLIGSIDKDLHKVVTYCNSIVYLKDERLKDWIERKKIGNCTFDGINYLSKDTINTRRDTIFKEKIDEEYKKFMAKSAMLGRNVSFKYRVEGRDVKLIAYKGHSKQMVVPSFITSICQDAFEDILMDNIKLNEGLMFIGHQAFKDCGLSTLTVPSTVEFALISAFIEERKATLFSNTINVELINKKTLLV